MALKARPLNMRTTLDNVWKLDASLPSEIIDFFSNRLVLRSGWAMGNESPKGASQRVRRTYIMSKPCEGGEADFKKISG